MRIKSGFTLRRICGETVVVGEGAKVVNFGHMLCLNETAEWLWVHAQGCDFTVDQLAEAMVEEYDVSLEQAKTDIAGIVDEWKSLGMTE